MSPDNERMAHLEADEWSEDNKSGAGNVRIPVFSQTRYEEDFLKWPLLV